MMPSDTKPSYLVTGYGMPVKLAQGIDCLRDLWPYHDGPAHIVLADFNLENHFIESCIAGCAPGQDPISNSYESTDHPVYAATAAVLQWILDNTTEEERATWMRSYE